MEEQQNHGNPWDSNSRTLDKARLRPRSSLQPPTSSHKLQDLAMIQPQLFVQGSGTCASLSYTESYTSEIDANSAVTTESHAWLEGWPSAKQ